MIRSLTATGLLAVFCLCAACGDTTEPAVAVTELAGTSWVASGWDHEMSASIHTRVAELPAEKTGYTFGGNGELVYRNSGWCGTPPLNWSDTQGVWLQHADGTLEICHGWYSGFYEIVRLTPDDLRLRSLGDLPPPRNALDGDWSGTYTLVDLRGEPESETGAVEVTFDGFTFTVQAAQRLLPPSAFGCLAASPDIVVFRDTSMHTADYDWTLNINGPFVWELDGDTLSLEQRDRGRQRLRTFVLHRD